MYSINGWQIALLNGIVHAIAFKNAFNLRSVNFSKNGERIKYNSNETDRRDNSKRCFFVKI